MKIKIISIILTFILCLSSICALAACGDDSEAPTGSETGSSAENGTREEETMPPPLDVADGDDLSYVLIENQTAYAVLGLFNESGAIKIIIPSEFQGLPVTAICESAFSSSEPLEELIIPDSITHIGSYAFDGCTNIKSIEMSENLVFVGEGAFDGCDSLPLTEYENALYLGDKDAPYTVLMSAADTDIESCTVHTDTKIIYDYAFLECTEVDEIIIPNGIRYVGSYAFEECYDLFPNGSDYNGAFYLGNDDNPYLVLVETKGRRELTSITIHEDTEIIAPGAFFGCELLESLLIPESVRLIGQYAFEGCTALKEITLADSSWRVINGDSVAVSVIVDTDEGNITERLVEVYYYCTWQKK